MRLLALTTLSILLVAHAMGQSTASVSGHVQDSSGYSIVGANVTLTNTQTGIVNVARTNNDGNFAMPDVLPGEYKLTVSKEGFAATESAVFTSMLAMQRICRST